MPQQELVDNPRVLALTAQGAAELLKALVLRGWVCHDWGRDREELDKELGQIRGYFKIDPSNAARGLSFELRVSARVVHIQAARQHLRHMSSAEEFIGDHLTSFNDC